MKPSPLPLTLTHALCKNWDTGGLSRLAWQTHQERCQKRGKRMGKTSDAGTVLITCLVVAKKIHTGVPGVVSEAREHSSSPISCGDLEQVTDLNKASVSSSAKYRPHRIAVSIK